MTYIGQGIFNFTADVYSLHGSICCGVSPTNANTMSMKMYQGNRLALEGSGSKTTSGGGPVPQGSSCAAAEDAFAASTAALQAAMIVAAMHGFADPISDALLALAVIANGLDFRAMELACRN